MKSAKSAWFKDLDKSMQEKINDLWRESEFERRYIYYPNGVDENTLPWYFKTDYINNFSMSDNNLFDFCPDCGDTEKAAEFISETGYECRTVTVKCHCGCIYQYGG